MDIKVLKELLSVLDQAGIREAVFEPMGNGQMRVRGSNAERSIAIFDTIDVDLVDLPLGIQSIAGLLSRVNLFDEEKAKIETTKDDGMIKELVIKQGRRKASFRFGNPLLKKGGLNVPHEFPEVIDGLEEIVFPEEYVKYLSSVISSMGYTGEKKKRELSFEADGGATATIKISDGEDDSFVDEIDLDGVSLSTAAAWEVTPFERMLKQSMEVNVGKKAKFGISENHVAVFDLGIVRALVVPLY